MKKLPEAIKEILERAAKDGSPSKPVSYRAIEAKADFMDGIPPEFRSEAIREIDRAIDLCESPIEQVALYQIAGHNFGNSDNPARCRILRKRGEIGYYPDRIHLIPQVAFGSYRVDFLLDIGGTFLIAIECDGKEFHTDKDRDARRDKELLDQHGVRVIRAPGGAVWRDNSLIALIAESIKASGRI